MQIHNLHTFERFVNPFDKNHFRNSLIKFCRKFEDNKGLNVVGVDIIPQTHSFVYETKSYEISIYSLERAYERSSYFILVK